MVTVNDFVPIRVTTSMQDAAIEYAGRSLNYTYNRMNYSQARQRLRRIAVGIIMEKAFETYLINSGIPFTTQGRTHWRNPDVAEFYINNRIVDIKGYHVYPNQNRNFPHWFLNVEGLVPYGQLKKINGPDTFVQAFLVSPYANNSNQKRFIVTLPKNWTDRWKNVSNVGIQTQPGNFQGITLTMHGEDANIVGTNANDLSESFILGNGQKQYLSTNVFSSLQYLNTDARPTHDIILSVNGLKHVVKCDHWFDMWLEKPEVTFASWGDRSTYLSGTYLPDGTITQVYTNGTRTKNMSVIVNALNPIREL
ncbi:hypothetical protein [Salirhabdus sp. Marseille-P4669]|uniref:hypothetical protein n=1 Tax=Salirhabdus sp. Marseille-P4669 TaxID=2042310 RepID=UPI000C7DDE5C|nr:hypothetical protein [Salirhabdus sp. Marseille-P4669]